MSEPMRGLRAVVGDLIDRVVAYGFPSDFNPMMPAALDREVDAILKAGQFDQVQRRAQKAEALATDALRLLSYPHADLEYDAGCDTCVLLARPDARALLEPGT